MLVAECLRVKSAIAKAYSQCKAAGTFLYHKWCMTEMSTKPARSTITTMKQKLLVGQWPQLKWFRLCPSHLLPPVSTRTGWATQGRSPPTCTDVLKLSGYHTDWKMQFPVYEVTSPTTADHHHDFCTVWFCLFQQGLQEKSFNTNAAACNNDT